MCSERKTSKENHTLTKGIFLYYYLKGAGLLNYKRLVGVLLQKLEVCKFLGRC